MVTDLKAVSLVRKAVTMKLIDKDKLLEEMRKFHPYSYGMLSDIEYFPTAYDVDKVARKAERIIELEFKWLRAVLFEEGRITYSSLDIAERGIKETVKMITEVNRNDS